MMHISGSAGGSIGTILTSLERIQTIFALDTVCVYPCTLYASMANAAPAIKYHESGVVELVSVADHKAGKRLSMS